MLPKPPLISALRMIQQIPQIGQVERIERALVLLAYFIELDGDVHLPMYEKFEAELVNSKPLPT
jgi:hypothetical protein